MRQFIENILHQEIQIKDYNGKDKLPLSLRGSYDFYELQVNGMGCILAEPRENFGLAVMRKQWRRMEQMTGQYCVLCFKNLQSYPRSRMLEEGIPFIWENHQVYMPFLGILLRQNEARALRPCARISFLTQKLLLIMLYEKWQDTTVTVAANALNVSKMSITRCFDEIESLEIPVLHKKGRVRAVGCYGSRKETWDLLKPHMRNPLIQEFYLETELPDGLLKSGISALCEYSMLGDNEYKTYALVKPKIARIRNIRQTPKGEVPACIVQELGYEISYGKASAIDPLTVLLLLERERQDPRVEKALEEMLEGYVW